MKIGDPIIWATMLDENPLPEGCPAAPGDWATWWVRANDAGRLALAAAAVPRLAEYWADQMELALDADDRLTVADVAAPTFLELAGVVRPIVLDEFHYGCVVAMLAASWLHGPALAVWFKQQLHAHGVIV